MHSYIIINHTPETFEVALFINNKLHEQHHEDKRLASKCLIPLIDRMLTHNNMTLAHLAFLGINQGPGLFSTLRSIIATANGLHFSTNIPLIGIDALNATALEFYDSAYEYTITLLNAYNGEVYYTITHHKKIIAQGYDTIEHFLSTLIEKTPASSLAKTLQNKQQAIRFIGNGTIVHQEAIKNHPDVHAFIPKTIPTLCSTAMIATRAEEAYMNGNYSSYLFPLHLKKHPVER